MIAALLSLITLIATAIRIHAITAKSFWSDEGFSVEIARLPWSDFLHLLWHREANMVLYYLILRFWLLFGSTEGFVRGLSVLFSVATVPLMYALGKRLFGYRAGLLAAWLLAINAYHVRYAQEARSYALVVFLSVLATWLLTRNLQKPSSAHWGSYAACTVLIVYSHFFGGFVVLAHWVSLVFLRRSEIPWRKLVRNMLWFIYLMIPIEVFSASTGMDAMNWIPKAGAKEILQFLVEITGNYGISLVVLVAVAVGSAGFVGWTTWRIGGRNLKGWAFALVFAWLFVPALAVLAVSAARPLFVARYLSPSVPALILIIAAGITRLRPAASAWVLCSAISVCSILGVHSYYRQDFDLIRQDWRAATAFVLDHAQSGDGAFFYSSTGRMPFEYYRSERHPSPQWPEVLQSPGGLALTYRDYLYFDLDEALRDSRPAGNRVWLVLVYDTDSQGKPNQESLTLRSVYGKGRHLVEARDFSNVTILLFARNAEDSNQASGKGD